MKYSAARRNTVLAAKRDGYNYALVVEEGEYVIRRMILCDPVTLVIGDTSIDWPHGCFRVRFNERDM